MKTLLHKIRNLGISEDHSFTDKMRFQIINMIYLVCALVWIVYITASAMFANQIVSDLGGIVVTIIGFILISRQKHNAAAHLIFISHNILWVLFDGFFEGDMGTEVFTISMLPLALFYFETKRSNIFYVVFIFTCYILSEYECFGLLPTLFSFQSNFAFFYNVNIVISFTAIIVAAYLFKENSARYRKGLESLNHYLNQKNEEIEQQSNQIAEQKEELEKSYEQITQSVEYAKKIQQAILPLQSKIAKDLPNHFIFFQPRDIVSGDFYWYRRVNGKSLIAAVDCTGHGVPGAFMSMIGNELLNEIVMRKKCTEPDKVLEHLNDGIYNALQREENDLKDGMEMSLVAIDWKNQMIQFAGAKNSLLVVNSGNIEELKGDKKAIGGLLSKPNGFTKQELPIQRGLQLYLYTDGFPDQFGGNDDVKLKNKNFKEILARMDQKALEEQQKILKNSFEEWKRDREQLDDVLVIGIKL